MYCGEPLWPRGSVLGLRPPGLEFRILCDWRTVSSHSSHHPQEVLLAQFSLYVHKGGLKPDLFHFYIISLYIFKILINVASHSCINKSMQSWHTKRAPFGFLKLGFQGQVKINSRVCVLIKNIGTYNDYVLKLSTNYLSDTYSSKECWISRGQRGCK